MNMTWAPVSVTGSSSRSSQTLPDCIHKFTGLQVALVPHTVPKSARCPHVGFSPQVSALLGVLCCMAVGIPKQHLGAAAAAWLSLPLTKL
jgi:hypothetical protein